MHRVSNISLLFAFVVMKGSSEGSRSNKQWEKTRSQSLAPEEKTYSTQNVINGEDDEARSFSTFTHNRVLARRTMLNFVLMSVIFSANHGCVVACLSLATARFGSTGAWQNGILYLSITSSALLGATYIVKQLGGRNALMVGMALYCIYVACFLVATVHPSLEVLAAFCGAIIGGVGGGFLWTAQGSYFSQAAEEHAMYLGQAVSVSNSTLASIFAFVYLAEEVALRGLSTLLLQVGWQWTVIFGIYTTVSILSTFLILFVHDYSNDNVDSEPAENSIEAASSVFISSSQTLDWRYKLTAAWQLLRNDPKMKYMIGLNAVFGFTSAFLNSYINGEVVRTAMQDDQSKFVGIFNALASCAAAFMSLVFGRIAPHIGNGPVLIFGALCFFGVVFPFVLVPDTTKWTTAPLMLAYILHGSGRATFEGTLKATFADFFAFEKEGAFANIILQNGLSGAIAYVLTFTLHCPEESRYCIRFQSDGKLHDILSFELIAMSAAVAAIAGFLRAAKLHHVECEGQGQAEEDTAMLEQTD